MSEKLTQIAPLPCPFCGVAIEVIEGDDESHDAWNHPSMGDIDPPCFLLGFELAYGDGDHERWNQRAAEAKHDRLLAGLRGLERERILDADDYHWKEVIRAADVDALGGGE